MKRVKIFIVIVLSVMVTFFLVNVGFTKENEKPLTSNVISYDSKEVNIVRIVGHWLGEGKREKLLRNFLRSYEFENQRILVDLKFPQEIFTNNLSKSQNTTRLISSEIFKGKSDWDILPLNNLYEPVAKYTNNPKWTKENLVDFSLIPEFRNNTLPYLLSDKMKNKYGGIIPGPFLEGSYWTLWTNKNLANRLGIDIKVKGMTFEDFLTYIKIVHEYNKENPYDKIIPLNEAGDWRTMFVLAFQLYASAYDNANLLFEENITSEKLIAWGKTLKALEELAQFNLLDDNWENSVWDDNKSDVLHDKCLFMINGSWMYNIWENEYNKDAANAFPVELPVFNKTKCYPASYDITWCVPKNSPNKNEAIELLLAMTNPKVAEQWVQNTKCPTGIKSRLTGQSFGVDLFEDFSDYIQNNYRDNIYTYSEDIAKYIIGEGNIDNTYYLEVVTGRASAEEAMNKIAMQLQ